MTSRAKFALLASCFERRFKINLFMLFNTMIHGALIPISDLSLAVRPFVKLSLTSHLNQTFREWLSGRLSRFHFCFSQAYISFDERHRIITLKARPLFSVIPGLLESIIHDLAFIPACHSNLYDCIQAVNETYYDAQLFHRFFRLEGSEVKHCCPVLIFEKIGFVILGVFESNRTVLRTLATTNRPVTAPQLQQQASSHLAELAVDNRRTLNRFIVCPVPINAAMSHQTAMCSIQNFIRSRIYFFVARRMHTTNYYISMMTKLYKLKISDAQSEILVFGSAGNNFPEHCDTSNVRPPPFHKTPFPENSLVWLSLPEISIALPKSVSLYFFPRQPEQSTFSKEQFLILSRTCGRGFDCPCSTCKARGAALRIQGHNVLNIVVGEDVSD